MPTMTPVRLSVHSYLKDLIEATSLRVLQLPSKEMAGLLVCPWCLLQSPLLLQSTVVLSSPSSSSSVLVFMASSTESQSWPENTMSRQPLLQLPTSVSGHVM